MEQLVEQHPEPSAHFAHELVAHLYDEEAALPMVTGWLERFFRAPLHEVMQQEHVRQTVQQTALANLINSCRRLAQIEWRELFESTSRAESELAADPAGIYARSDFETRDRCRSVVEEIARWSKRSEHEIIDAALTLAHSAEGEVARHVGYYLIDAGRPALEQAMKARVPLAERWRRSICAHAAGSYFGSILAAHNRDDRAAASFHRAVSPWTNARIARLPSHCARQRTGGAGGELFRDLDPAAAGAGENVLRRGRHPG